MNFLNFDPRTLLISVVPFILAIMIHEVSHGYAAYLLGDPTAKNAGRLTLNPLKHIDPLGLLCLLITRMFGWAKPVPVNFSIVSRKKYGPLMVAAAGPVSNIALALVSLFALYLFFSYVPYREGSLSYEFVYNSLVFSVMINVTLALFNLIPILPLDGGRILHNLLPYDKAYSFAKTERWGFFIILALIVTGVIDKTIFPLIRIVYESLLNIVFKGFIGM